MLVIYFQLVLMVLIWSFSFVVVDIAVEFMPPLSVAFYRFIVVSLTFIIIDIYHIYNNKKKKIHLIGLFQ